MERYTPSTRITDRRRRVVNRLLAVVVCKADIGYIVALGVLLKLALAGLVAGGTLRAVACKQKLNYHLAVLAQLCGVRAHDHAVLGNYGACSLDAATLVFDNAKPAAAVYRQAFAVAEEDVIFLAEGIAAEIPAEGATLVANVESNVSYSVDLSADWLSKIESKAAASSEVKIAAAANETMEERSATITIVPQSGRAGSLPPLWRPTAPMRGPVPPWKRPWN